MALYICIGGSELNLVRSSCFSKPLGATNALVALAAAKYNSRIIIIGLLLFYHCLHGDSCKLEDFQKRYIYLQRKMVILTQ